MCDKQHVNGEHGIIIKLIEQCHKQNRTDIEAILSSVKTLTDKVSTLPCASHDVRLSYVEEFPRSKKKWRFAISICLVGMLGLFAHGFIEWGEAKAQRKQFMKVAEKMVDHIKIDEARWNYYLMPTESMEERK